MTEVVVPSTCYVCGAPYSGPDVLLCPVCQRRERGKRNADPVDRELWWYRQLAAEARWHRVNAPPEWDDL